MIAALVGWRSGVWYPAASFALIFAVSALGCWFGAPPNERRQIIRKTGRTWTQFLADVRYKRSFSRWERQMRKAHR